jgi:uncharacterized membrane protein
MKKISFSKILITFMMAVVAVVILYSMIEMHIQQNLDALPVLIGATVTEIIGCGIFYLKKSTIENSKGGITYDTAINNINDKISETERING